MRRNVGLLCLLFLLSVDFCCNSNKYDVLSLEQRPFDGSELRIDGYYYTNRPDGFMTVFFLYSNGILLHGGDFSPSKLSINEELYRNGKYNESSNKYKIDWGLFNIDAGTIKYERWQPVDLSIWVFRYEGTILNDTTFHISYSQRVDGEYGNSEDITYHFRAFSPKPDSTCPFIP